MYSSMEVGLRKGEGWEWESWECQYRLWGLGSGAKTAHSKGRSQPLCNRCPMLTCPKVLQPGLQSLFSRSGSQVGPQVKSLLQVVNLGLVCERRRWIKDLQSHSSGIPVRQGFVSCLPLPQIQAPPFRTMPLPTACSRFHPVPHSPHIPRALSQLASFRQTSDHLFQISPLHSQPF